MFTNASAIAAKPALVRRDSVGASIPTAVVIDFARARKVGGTAQIRAALSDKNRNALPPEHFPEKACPGPDPGWTPVFRRKCDHSLTGRALDLVVIAGLFLATTFYPALIWLLLLLSGE